LSLLSCEPRPLLVCRQRCALQFGDIMCNIVNQVQTDFVGRSLENLLETLANPMSDHLPIGKGVIHAQDIALK